MPFCSLVELLSCHTRFCFLAGRLFCRRSGGQGEVKAADTPYPFYFGFLSQTELDLEEHRGRPQAVGVDVIGDVRLRG